MSPPICLQLYNHMCVLMHDANHLQNTHNHASITDIWMLGIRNQCVCYIPYNMVFVCNGIWPYNMVFVCDGIWYMVMLSTLHTRYVHLCWLLYISLHAALSLTYITILWIRCISPCAILHLLISAAYMTLCYVRYGISAMRWILGLHVQP